MWIPRGVVLIRQHPLLEVRRLLDEIRHLKTDGALFSRKIHFCPNLGKKRSKWPLKGFFFGFFEKFCH